MAKRPPRRIPSDDCVIVQDGEQYHEHEGEWILLLGRPSIAESDLLGNFGGEEIKAPEDPGEDAMDSEKTRYQADLATYKERRQERSDRIEEEFTEMISVMAQYIVGWNWTNTRGLSIVPINAEYEGEPCAMLDGDPEVFRRLDVFEVLYLRNLLLRGETPAERKNESSGSETGSLTRGRKNTGRT